MTEAFLNLDLNCFRFLTAGERQKAYMLILSCLFHERLEHQSQIFHDILFGKVKEQVEKMTGFYADAQFRSDIDQLVEWGNVTRKVEGRRVRSLSDNSLRRNLLTISEQTFQLMRFLFQQLKPRQTKTVARGFMLLQDLRAMLEQFENVLEEFYSGDRSQEKLQRAWHLIDTMDAKVEDTVSELTGLADQLHSFLEANDEFHAEDYDRLMFQLEAYNQGYLSQLIQEVDRLFLRLSDIERHPCLEEFLTDIDGFLEQNSSAGKGDMGRKFNSLVVFFNPESGKLDFYNQRVQRELGESIRRIRNYLKIKRDRSLRIQEIRARRCEMFQAEDELAARWVQKLYSSVTVPVLDTDATPEDRQPAPLPRKKSDRNRQTRAARPIERVKQLTVEQNRELEKRKIELINRFFAEKILKGRPDSSLSEAELLSTADFKTLLHGIKLAKFKKGRISDLLKFSVENPFKDETASFANDESEFSCPDHKIRNINNG
ncbi:MAG: DUF2397 family protein [Candidatus Riflebacteria bacterium]